MLKEWEAKHGQRGWVAKPLEGRPAVLVGAHQLRPRLVEEKAFRVPATLPQWKAAAKTVQCHVSWNTLI